MADITDSMNDAVQNVLAGLYDDSSSDDDDNVDPTEALIELVRGIEVPEPTNPKIPTATISVKEFDPSANMLDPEVRAALALERIFEETDIFTEPMSTTNTMAGYLANVALHERELIGEVIPDDRIIEYSCNYGRVTYPGYIPPPRSIGARKKKSNKKPRKKQGDGSSFNSQITCVVRSHTTPTPVFDADLGYSIIPTDTPVYKIKVFRTGVVQLPGALTHLIGDVIDCVGNVVQALNFHLHTGEEDETKRIHAINTNPVMKNYKFAIKMPEDHILDVGLLKRLLLTNARGPRLDNMDRPRVFDVNYTRQNTKLSVQFSTPIPRKAKKRTCVNVFMRGRINILGAFDVATTRKICEYLHELFAEYYEDLVVPEGGMNLTEWRLKYAQNIATPTDEEIDADIMALEYKVALPDFTHEEWTEVRKFIDDAYYEQVREFEAALEEFFDD